MWVPQDIYSLLDLLLLIGKVMLILIILPHIYQVLETIFFWLIRALLGIFRIRLSVKFQIRPFFYRLFFLGGLVKRFFYFSIAKKWGYKIRSHIYLGGYTSSGNVHVGGDASFIQTVVFGFASYMLVLFSLFLHNNLTLLVNFLTSLGMGKVPAVILSWWLVLSIFVTGRPRGHETLFPLETIIKFNPDLFLMAVSIFVSSLFLMSSIGRYYTQVLVTIQVSLLILLEIRKGRETDGNESEEEVVITTPELGYLG